MLLENLFDAHNMWAKDGDGSGSGRRQGAATDPESGKDATPPAAADGDGQDTDGSNSSGTGDEGGMPEITSYQSLYDSLDEGHRGLIDAEFETLRSTVDKVRKERKDDNKALKEQLAILEKQVAKGSDAQKSLEKIIAERDAVSASFEAAQAQLDFYDEARAYEKANQVRLTNPGLAWIAIQEEKKNPDTRLFDRHGRVDFKMLTEQYPELFAQEKSATTQARTRAGAGTGQPDTPPTVDMNTLIRQKAGYQ